MSESKLRLPWMMILLNYRNQIIIGAVVLVAVLSIGGRLMGWWSGHREHDFIQAETEAIALATDVAHPEEPLGRLEKILGRHGELQQKYDGALAQCFLAKGDGAKSFEYAKRLFERTQDKASYYAVFAGNSVLIADNQLTEALSRSLNLANALNRDPTFGPSSEASYGRLLRLYNQVRIATLHQALGHAAEERAAWKELLTEMDKPANAVARDQLLNSFRSGELTLVDYAKMRLSNI